MKIFTLIIALLLSNSSKSQTISISFKHIFINKVKFDTTSLIADYIKVLGKPTRIFHGSNNIYTFDSSGIYIYENFNRQNKIIDISFDLVNLNQYDFSPIQIFKGKIILSQYKYKIRTNSSYEDLKNLCSQYKNTSLEIDEQDSDFIYGIFDIFLEHNIHLNQTKKVSIDFNSN